MVDINSFTSRLGITKADVARQLGLDPKSNTLSLYSKGKSFPPFEMCRKLLMAGMTIQELFGDEVADNVVVYADKKPVQDVNFEAKIDFDDPVTKSALARAISDLLVNKK